MGTENRKGPLKDVKVLDFTIALAGGMAVCRYGS